MIELTTFAVIRSLDTKYINQGPTKITEETYVYSSKDATRSRVKTSKKNFFSPLPTFRFLTNASFGKHNVLAKETGKFNL